MLQTPTSAPWHVSILTLNDDEKVVVSEKQHALETRLFKQVSNSFFFLKSEFLQ